MSKLGHIICQHFPLIKKDFKMNIVSKHALKHLKIMVSTSRLAYVTVSLEVT